MKVTPRGLARLNAGHPWIFRADLADGGARPETETVVVTDPRGRCMGSAFFAPPPSPVALRVYARGASAVPFDERLLAERIDLAVCRREEMLGEAAGACRLVHAEADLLPGLFVDRYEDVVVLQTATAPMDRREEVIARLLARRVAARLVVARDDGSVRDHEGLPRRKGVLFGQGSTRARFCEGTAVFEVDVLADAKTGGFLDQRENHLAAGRIAKGEALDVFTYHGGFAFALAGGAASVLAVDEDPTAVERARANAVLSGRTNVELRQADAFALLRELERTGRRFDTIVLDPPALAKRHGTVTSALRAYHELNLRALRLLRANGWLITCSCSGRVTPALFEEMLVKAASDAAREVAIVERRGAGRDHPERLGVLETSYLKCWFLRVLS